nr:MAG TPA: hypothetical protein [Caudoviricetes sp.]
MNFKNFVHICLIFEANVDKIIAILRYCWHYLCKPILLNSEKGGRNDI